MSMSNLSEADKRFDEAIDRRNAFMSAHNIKFVADLADDPVGRELQSVVCMAYADRIPLAFPKMEWIIHV